MDARIVKVRDTEIITTWLNSKDAATRKRGNQGGASKRTYLDAVTSFDIETSKIRSIEQSIMYVWQWSMDNDIYIVGRTWKEFSELCILIESVLESRGITLCVYVHNLSYEFAFLCGIYRFKPHEVFAMKPHKILKCTMGKCLEFRCSYIHSNMSLRVWLKKLDIPTQKGELDYNIFRTPNTVLTDAELDYCIRDVKGVVEAIQREMELDCDNLYTIPLTSTGYVRRDVKKAIRELPKNYIKKMNLSKHQYEMAKEAFRGGDTHANRYYAGIILENVRRADRSSSYPGVLCNRKFPVSRFRDLEYVTAEDMIAYLDGNYAIMMRVSLYKLRLRDEYNPSPYLSYSKCRAVENKILDNGRILQCDYLETTITDIDLKIILREYDFDSIDFFDVSIARYGYLPSSIIQVIIEYYRSKTELKDVPGMEVYYTKSKNKINACYGMMATDPIRDNWLYVDGDWEKELQEMCEQINNYHDHVFLPYQWGVWTTAHARYELREGIWLTGDKTVYHDTDSDYYLGDSDFSDYNRRVMKLSKDSGAYGKDKYGKIHYMEVYEEEETVDRYVTWGAKKYAYEIGDKLCVTISGVGKDAGAVELREHGGLEALKPGFIFSDAGGRSIKYNNIENPYIFTHGDEKLLITSNAYIDDSTYTLNITKEYEKIIDYCCNILKHILKYEI